MYRKAWRDSIFFFGRLVDSTAAPAPLSVGAALVVVTRALVGGGGGDAEIAVFSFTFAVVEAATAAEADRAGEALSSILLAPDEVFFRKSGRPFLNMAIDSCVFCVLCISYAGGGSAERRKIDIVSPGL
jgi:hypothetical protein